MLARVRAIHQDRTPSSTDLLVEALPLQCFFCIASDRLLGPVTLVRGLVVQLQDRYTPLMRRAKEIAAMPPDDQFADGLSELLAEPAFEPYRIDIVLSLLREFPNASPFRLGELLGAAAKLPATHDGLLELVPQIFSGAIPVKQRQRDLWLATAYTLSPASFEDDVQQRARTHPAFIFDLRDKGGFGDDQQPLPGIAFAGC
jgi:hypothetical protein